MSNPDWPARIDALRSKVQASLAEAQGHDAAMTPGRGMPLGAAAGTFQHGLDMEYAPKASNEAWFETRADRDGFAYLPYFTDGPPGYKTRADQIPPERWEFEPIYPRRGWAGASEAAIWEAVFGEGRYAYVGADILVDSAGVVTQCPPADNEGGPFIVANPAALILALQNAMTLQARLREGRE